MGPLTPITASLVEAAHATPCLPASEKFHRFLKYDWHADERQPRIAVTSESREEASNE